MDVEILKAQHRRIIRLASALGGVAESLKTTEDAGRARELMGALNAALIEHLVIEDGELYPVLMTSHDPAVRQLAQDYVDDMGAVSGAWTHYFNEWTQAKIVSDRSRFATATKGLIGALAHRVAREDDTLYPAMEAADAGSGSVRGEGVGEA
ncbi:hemerythrin domain-containing protein [Brevundimonas sp.]|uniref:hemerythrin domain-containing protein n=1 Tax=Brevundimonas sp. TaxID=1871086 RepID=UPI003567438E